MEAAVERVETTEGTPVLPGFVTHAVLGRGGMGIVYRATMLETGEDVALKLMLPEVAENPVFRERFLREMQLLPALEHPNVIPIREAGQLRGHLYIAMKLVEGPDLKALLSERGRLPAEETLAICRQVADALDAAHENGIVHRDVKPQNVLIEETKSSKPHVFLTDFGLVKQVMTDSSASRVGQLLGSIRYMPPEQIEGRRTDGRADVYSLGCVLFECFTGHVPFERDTDVATMWAHVQDEPPRLDEHVSGIAGGASDVLARALAKDPQHRFLTCGQLIGELEKGLGEKRVRYAVPRRQAPSTRRSPDVWSPNFFPELSLTKRNNRGGIFAAAVAVAVLAGALVVSSEDPVRRQLVDAAGQLREALPEFRRLEEQERPDERPRQARDEPAEIARRGSPGPGIRAGAPRAAPAAPVIMTAPEDLLPAQATQSQGAPPANGLLAFDRDMEGTAQSDIFIAKPDGTGIRNLTPGMAKGDSTPAWSPTGERLAFTSNRYDGQNYDLLLMNADGSGVVRLRTGRGADANPSWSPDAKRIVYENRADQGVVDWTQAGAFTGDYEVRVIDVATGRIEGLAKGSNPSWSPEGDVIAFTYGGDLYSIQADGTSLRRLTDTDAIEESPDWAPDGRSLVYVRDGDLYVMSRNGGRVAPLVQTGRDTYAVQPAWSPDGRWIAYGLVTQGEANELWVMKLGGTERRYVAEGRGFVDWQRRPR